MILALLRESVDAFVPRADLAQANPDSHDALVARGSCLAWAGSVHNSDVPPALGNDRAYTPGDDDRVAAGSCVA